MAKTRKTKKRTKDGPSVGMRLKEWLGSERGGKVRRGLGRVLILVLITGGAAWGLGMMEAYVREASRQRGVELEVKMLHRPAWATEELVRDICLSSGIHRDDELLDETLTRHWADQLMRNPWLKRVRKLHKQYDGTVVIDCELRQPIAVVHQIEGDYYLDAEGIVLPAVRLADAHLVSLEGTVDHRLSFGEPVSAPALMAGLEVLSLIRQVDEQLPAEEGLWGELARLDVGNYEGRLSDLEPHLTLYSRNHTEIRWGVAVGKERAYMEASAQHKLASLYRVYEKHGSLDVYQYVELRDMRKEKADPLRRG